jgi:hypothetical protein
MNNERERGRGANRGMAVQPSETQELVLPAALVVERLRLEAILVAQQFAPVAAGKSILLPHPGFAVFVEIDQKENAGFEVGIFSHLGQALLADEARRILESGCVEVGGQHVKITEDGAVAVRWSAAYPGQVDVVAVHAGLLDNLQVAFRVQRALAEDCYLKPHEHLSTFMQKARP